MANIRSPMHRAKQGVAPSIEWARWVETEIRRIQENQPIPHRPIFPGPPEKTEPFWTEISQVPDSPGDYEVTITPGYLIYQNATATDADDGVTGWIAPKINGLSVEDDEVQPLPLPGVVSWVYLRVKTDADGAPKFAANPTESWVTIEAFTSKQTSVHHVRPSPDGGEEEGDYFFLILQTESNGQTPEAPRAVRRLTGNVELRNQLIEIENVGGEIELYKGYDPGPDDKHQLKTLKQLEGGGVRVIKSEVGNDEDTVDFRDVKQGGAGQIHVTSSGDSIIVEGNGYAGTYTGAYNQEIQVYDGLVSYIGLPTLETFTGLVVIIDGCGTIAHHFDFAKGLLLSYQQTAVS